MEMELWAVRPPACLPARSMNGKSETPRVEERASPPLFYFMSRPN